MYLHTVFKLWYKVYLYICFLCAASLLEFQNVVVVFVVVVVVVVIIIEEVCFDVLYR